MAWSVAEAKQRLSEVLRSATREPQMIYSRSRPVAVILTPELFREFAAWQTHQKARTVGQAFAELRSLVAGTHHGLPIPSRRNRRDSFSKILK